MYRGIRYRKSACVYVPLYCLYSRIISQIARRRISTPNGLLSSTCFFSLCNHSGRYPSAPHVPHGIANMRDSVSPSYEGFRLDDTQ